MVGVLRHVDVVLVEECSVRGLAVHVSETWLYITCQTLREVVRFGEVVADDLTPHVYREAMLVGTFCSSG